MLIRKAVESDIKPIADNMREHDIVEVGYLGLSPYEALKEGFDTSSFTVLDNDTPVMMFGIRPIGLSSAVVWALGTDGIHNVRKEFMKYSIVWRDVILDNFQLIYNYVDINNKESIRWLKWLGATFDEPKPFGKGIFMRFQINV